MTLQALYEKIGGNYAEARSRLMSESLMDRFVLKFLAEPSMSQLTAAVADGNIEESFLHAHTLKGVAANMAFTDLAKKASALTEQLRPRAEKANPTLFEAVSASHEATIAAIKEYQVQKK